MQTGSPTRPVIAEHYSHAAPVVNALTVDVEDWFHATFLGVSETDWSGCEARVIPNTQHLLKILDDHGVKATFFVLGWVAERAPELVRAIASAGHEIASHGAMHRQVFRQTPEEFACDVRKSLASLRPVTHHPILGFRAPAFSIGKDQSWALEILAEQGFQYDASLFPVRTPLYGVAAAPRFSHLICDGRLLEIPPATLQIGPWRFPIAGGVYFRTLPFSLILWGIRHLNQREKRPAVLYLHPWELDPQPPARGANGLARWSHGINKSSMTHRLQRLLQAFSFAPIREVMEIGLAPGTQR